MRLTWHIVRKDLVRLRWVLLLWVVVLTGYMALATIQAALDEISYYPFYIIARIFGALFLPLLGFGLVMGVQYDDPVSDSDAFWITRPISGPRLLGAKCVVLALLCLVPVLAIAPWWIAHGFDAGQLSRAAFQAARWQAVVALAAVPFALTSSNPGRFVMSVLLAAAGAYGMATALRFVGSDPNIAPTTVIESRIWVMLTLWMAAVVAVALIQFLTRRTRVASAVLLLALLACCAVNRWWVWPLGSDPVTVTSQATIQIGTPQPEIVAQLRAKTDEITQRHGLRIKLAEIMTSDPRGLAVTINESAPDPAADPWLVLLGKPKPVSAQEFYFLVNRDDGRTALARVTPAGETLAAGAITYRRRVLIFTPRASWNWDASAFNRWAQSAALVKVVASPMGSPAAEPDVLRLLADSAATAEK
jgi:hypothetical protein